MPMKSITLALGAIIAVSTAYALDASSREERKKEAMTLRERITIIDQFVPNLSPDQRLFVTSENAEIGKIADQQVMGSRLCALYQTKEMQLSKVKRLCSEGLRALDAVLLEPVSEEEELLGWLTFVALFMDPTTLNDGICILEDRKVLSKEDIEKMMLFGDIWGGHGQRLALDAESAMRDIVIPLYRSRMKGPNKGPEPTP